MPSKQRGSMFKRLETDAEFRARLAGHYLPSWHSGAAIDDYAWTYYRMQRRIIEVEA